MLRAFDGGLDGLFVMGQNPAVGSQHSGLQRRALAHLKWLVVRDLAELETATFWRDAPEVALGRAAHGGHPDRGLPDAGRRAHREGRALHQHAAAAAVARQGDRAARRRALGAVVHAPPVQAGARALRATRRTTATGRSGTSAGTTPSTARSASRTPRRCCSEINGYDVASGEPVSGFAELKADGWTACGCWIYAGCYADGVNQTRRREPGDLDAPGGWVSPEWAWAWPANRRMLYNRASADPEGKPWSERKRYVWWDEERGEVDGLRRAGLPGRQAARTTARADAKGMDAIAGTDPFIMMADGKGWLYSPAGLLDGPLPTHYEPFESPVAEPALSGGRLQPGGADLEPAGQPGPRRPATRATRSSPRRSGSPSTTPPAAMSRTLPWLAELQPEMFAEIDPMLAAERGIEDGGWMVIETERAEIEARARVTARMRPLRDRRASGPPGGAAVALGLRGALVRRQRERPRRARRRPERLDPGGQGVHLRRPRRPAQAASRPRS